jgi:hypothetical protein
MLDIVHPAFDQSRFMGFFICLGTFLHTAAGLAAVSAVTFFTAHFITSNGILIQILTDFSKLKIIAYLLLFVKNERNARVWMLMRLERNIFAC